MNACQSDQMTKTAADRRSLVRSYSLLLHSSDACARVSQSGHINVRRINTRLLLCLVLNFVESSLTRNTLRNLSSTPRRVGFSTNYCITQRHRVVNLQEAQSAVAQKPRDATYCLEMFLRKKSRQLYCPRGKHRIHLI